MQTEFSFLEVWKAISKLDQIEEFWKISIEGSLVWPLIRTRIATDWFFEDFEIKKDREKKIQFLKIRARIVLVSLLGNLYAVQTSKRRGLNLNKENKVLCVAYDDLRRDPAEGGRLRDPYFDYLLPAIRHLNPIVYNTWGDNATLKGRFFWPHNIGDQGVILRSLKRKFFPPRLGALQEKISSSVQCIEKLLETYCVRDIIPERVLNRARPFDLLITPFLLEKRFFKELLKRLGTKILITLGHSKFHWEDAARELGIICISLQQGLISELSPGNNIDASARKYKKMMSLPSIVTVNGKYFVDRLIAGGFWDAEEIVPIGFARLMQQIKTYPPLSPALKYPRKKVQILVTSDHNISASIARYINQVDEGLGPDKDLVEWVIKVHPWKDNLRPYTQVRARLRLIDEVKDRVSLYELMNESDIHLTSWSATTFEAIPYGVSTLFMNANGPILMSELIRRHIAFDACNPKVAIKIIGTFLHEDKSFMIDWAKKIMDQQKYFFEEDPPSQFKKLIDRCLQAHV
jgi:hypothetical protein